MAVRENTRKLHAAIKTEFQKMKAENKYLTTFIISEIAKKYYKSESTVEKIVFNRS